MGGFWERLGTRFWRFWESFWEVLGVVLGSFWRSFPAARPKLVDAITHRVFPPPAVRPKLVYTIAYFASFVSSLLRGVVVATVLRYVATVSIDVMTRFACAHHQVVNVSLCFACARHPLVAKRG